MRMILGIISDTHDHLQRIAEAIEVFRNEKVGAVVHCGDFVAPFALKLFQKLECPFYAVFGNNDGERKGLLKTAATFGGELQKPPHLFLIDNRKILLNHESLTEKKLNKLGSKPDFILTGHTHKADFTTLNGIPAINPGEACGWLTSEATIGILDLATGEYGKVALNG